MCDNNDCPSFFFLNDAVSDRPSERWVQLVHCFMARKPSSALMGPQRVSLFKEGLSWIKNRMADPYIAKQKGKGRERFPLLYKIPLD